MGLFSRKPKIEPAPPAPPVTPKYSPSDFHWVTLTFDDDAQAQQRAKEYVYSQVTDFRSTKDVAVRWLVQPLKGGNFGLYVGRTMMLDVAAHELLTAVMERAASMGAPLMLEGQYVWDVKSGPFAAYLYLPKDPAAVEMVSV